MIEYPFALPAPRRIQGRAAIHDYFAVVAAAPLRLETHNMVVHRTADPEVVIAEWDYDGYHDRPVIPRVEHPGDAGARRQDRHVARLSQPRHDGGGHGPTARARRCLGGREAGVRRGVRVRCRTRTAPPQTQREADRAGSGNRRRHQHLRTTRRRDDAGGRRGRQGIPCARNGTLDCRGVRGPWQRLWWISAKAAEVINDTAASGPAASVRIVAPCRFAYSGGDCRWVLHRGARVLKGRPVPSWRREGEDMAPTKQVHAGSTVAPTASQVR